MIPDKKQLIQTIEEAFKDVPYPGDDRISCLECCEDCLLVTEIFKGVKNENVTRAFLYKYNMYASSFVSLLKPEAYHYYIKAFIVLVIEYHNQLADWESYILFSLLPIEPEHSYYKEDIKQYDIFSAKQKHAIRLFLEYLLTTFPDYYNDDIGDSTPIDALNWYWKNY